MYTLSFWKDTFERVVRTAVQTLAGFLTADQLAGLEANPGHYLVVILGACFATLATAMGAGGQGTTAKFGDN